MFPIKSAFSALALAHPVRRLRSRNNARDPRQRRVGRRGRHHHRVRRRVARFLVRRQHRAVGRDPARFSPGSSELQPAGRLTRSATPASGSSPPAARRPRSTPPSQKAHLRLQRLHRTARPRRGQWHHRRHLAGRRRPAHARFLGAGLQDQPLDHRQLAGHRRRHRQWRPARHDVERAALRHDGPRPQFTRTNQKTLKWSVGVACLRSPVSPRATSWADAADDLHELEALRRLVPRGRQRDQREGPLQRRRHRHPVPGRP